MSFGCVEEAELDAGFVDGFGHFAAEGVQLADEVTFAESTDGGVAGHLADGLEVHGEQEGFEADAGGGEGGFDAGVSASDDDDVEVFSGSSHAVFVFTAGVLREVVGIWHLNGSEGRWQVWTLRDGARWMGRGGWGEVWTAWPVLSVFWQGV